MVIIFVLSTLAMAFLLYSFYKFWKEDCDGLREAMFRVRPQETLLFIGVGFLMWLSFTTPSSQIRDEYIDKNGKVTVIEHSLSGKVKVLHDVEQPVTTYGKVIKTENHSYLNGKMLRHRTDITVKLNDGRIMKDVIYDRQGKVKEGNGMSVVEKFYPSYSTEFNY